MKKFLALGVAAFVPFQAQAITVVVGSGDVVNGGTVPQVVTQNVEGTTNNQTVYGTQNIMSGGVANNSLIYTYAQQTVAAGGKAFGSTVMQQGLMNVSGTAEKCLYCPAENLLIWCLIPVCNMFRGKTAMQKLTAGSRLCGAAVWFPVWF